MASSWERRPKTISLCFFDGTDMTSQEASLPRNVPEGTIFVIGAGHFGGRAARLLAGKTSAPVFIVDCDELQIEGLRDLPVQRIHFDGVRFLAGNFHILSPSNMIVPAVPFHLAYEWLKAFSVGTYSIRKVAFPQEARSSLPLSWEGTEGSLLVSYADFMCPDDCEEPEFCTVTGERRENPLHDLLAHLHTKGFGVHIIRSVQLAPGVGGYPAETLMNLWRRVRPEHGKRWILGTACRCHGILTAFEIL